MKRLSQSLRDDAFIQNPYPFYGTARKHGDLVYWQDTGKVAAVSHRSVGQLFRNRAWGREIPQDLKPQQVSTATTFDWLAQNSMLELDPPRHTRLRGLVNRAFTSRNVVELETDIKDLAYMLLDHLPQQAELQKNFCEVLPVMVIARLLGVPADMCEQMLAWSHAMVAMYQANRDHKIETNAECAAKEFTDFIQCEIKNRRNAPKDDLISRLIEAEDKEGGLSIDELVSTCILLLNAGHEATANTLGSGIKTILASDLDPNRILAPTRRAGTVEEILRFDPPLHVFERQAKTDCELFGVSFRRGDVVALVLASANRDSAVWNSPDEFLPDRKTAAHTSFGAGIHFCVGAPLARLELAVGLAALFERYPNLTLAKEPRYADRYHFHGLEELWIRLF